MLLLCVGYPLADSIEYVWMHFHMINYWGGPMLLNIFILYKLFDPLSGISHQ